MREYIVDTNSSLPVCVSQERHFNVIAEISLNCETSTGIVDNA